PHGFCSLTTAAPGAACAFSPWAHAAGPASASAHAASTARIRFAPRLAGACRVSGPDRFMLRRSSMVIMTAAQSRLAHPNLDRLAPLAHRWHRPAAFGGEARRIRQRPGPLERDRPRRMPVPARIPVVARLLVGAHLEHREHPAHLDRAERPLA